MNTSPSGAGAISVYDRRVVFLLLALPFVFNDLLFALFEEPLVLYPIDYAVRIAILTACMMWPVSRQLARERLLPDAPVWHGVAVVVLLPAICWVAFWYFVSPLAFILGVVPQFRFPEIPNPFFEAFDLTFGLFLVAVSEELIFRKLAYGWLSKAGLSQARIVLWSAVFFSVTHWSGGFTPLLNTFIMGVLYMMAYIRLGRIWPLVLAHWLHNFIYLGLY